MCSPLGGLGVDLGPVTHHDLRSSSTVYLKVGEVGEVCAGIMRVILHYKVQILAKIKVQKILENHYKVLK